MISLVKVSHILSEKVSVLRFGGEVTHVYNPLEYAWKAHQKYLEKFGQSPKEILLIGMNPGPFGMAQTGVPFGEITAVRDWMGIETSIGKPAREHPKRKIDGFGCPKSEVSGRRLWGWAKDRYVRPEKFFKKFFVMNYCPLVFMSSSGKNFTPDNLPVEERDPLFELCDQALLKTVEILKPKYVLGVGAFAMKRAQESLPSGLAQIGKILHPSPSSPAANRGWAAHVEKEFKQMGIDIP